MFSPAGHAEGFVVDKVYHPHILPLERETERRLAPEKTDQGNRLMQSLGLAHSLSENLSMESYTIGERDDQCDFGFEAFEAGSGSDPGGQPQRQRPHLSAGNGIHVLIPQRT